MNNPLGGGLRREAEAGEMNAQVAETVRDFETADGVVKNTNTEMGEAKQGESADVVKITQTEAEGQVAQDLTKANELARAKAVFSTSAENTANISSRERAAEVTKVSGEATAEAAALSKPEKETGVQEQEYLDEDAEDREVEDGTGWEHDIAMRSADKLAKTAMKVVKDEVAKMTYPADLDRKKLKWTKQLLLSAYNRKYPGRAA